MDVTNIYSKRQKTIRGEVNDIYQYNIIPTKLKRQICHILNDTVGLGHTYATLKQDSKKKNFADKFYESIRKTLLHEYGLYRLTKDPKGYRLEVMSFFSERNTEYDYDDGDYEHVEQAIDVIELCFIGINTTYRNINSKYSEKADLAICVLNQRFRENGIGYQFESNEIIRVDSQLIHAEAVKPILFYLNDTTEYEGARAEFLSAHRHYREGNYKESLNDCLKSFESLMKAIHDKKGWKYKQGDTASRLINGCLENNLIPAYLQSQFTSLKTMLETGIPTIRNRNSGHGQGSEIKEVEENLVSYMLHLTATNLLFLARCADN